MRAYVPRNLNEDGMVEDTFGNFKNLTKYIRMDDYTRVTQLVEEQRSIIDEQVEENRGLRADVGVLQTANAEQRQEIDRYIDLIAQMGMTEINLVKENKRLSADLAYAGDRLEPLAEEHP